jgi:hypothetical protein
MVAQSSTRQVAGNAGFRSQDEKYGMCESGGPQSFA